MRPQIALYSGSPRMRSAQKTVLVTGGAGFIGSHLSEALSKEGFRVRILDDLSSGSFNNLSSVAGSVDLIQGSILDGDLVKAATAGCEAVFHLAAIVSVVRSIEDPIMAHQINTTGSLNVFEAAKNENARVIFSSSAAVYGNALNIPLPESAVAMPLSPYGAQKLLGENYLSSYYESHRLESISLRYFNVYGTRQDPTNPYSGVISIFSDRARAQEPISIYGDGTQTRDFVFVDDVVRANLAALWAKNVQAEVFNVATGTGTSIRELADQTIKCTESHSAIVFRSPRQGDILHSVGDPNLAAQRLNYKPSTTLQNGLDKLIGVLQGSF